MGGASPLSARSEINLAQDAELLEPDHDFVVVEAPRPAVAQAQVRRFTDELTGADAGGARFSLHVLPSVFAHTQGNELHTGGGPVFFVGLLGHRRAAIVDD